MTAHCWIVAMLRAPCFIANCVSLPPVDKLWHDNLIVCVCVWRLLSQSWELFWLSVCILYPVCRRHHRVLQSGQDCHRSLGSAPLESGGKPAWPYFLCFVFRFSLSLSAAVGRGELGFPFRYPEGPLNSKSSCYRLIVHVQKESAYEV